MSPPPTPRSTATAPGCGGGTSRPRASASQWRAAKGPARSHHVSERSSYCLRSLRARTAAVLLAVVEPGCAGLLPRAHRRPCLSARGGRPRAKLLVVRGLLRACHFQPTLAVTAITGILALVAGRGLGVIAVVAAVLCGQLSVGWSNDWLDRDRDRRAGRTDKPVAVGTVAVTTVRRAATTALVLTVPLSLLSG